MKNCIIVSPDGKQTEDKSTMFICKKCFSIVSKGLTHECKHNNLAKDVIILLEDVEQNRKEQIVSSLLDTFKKDNTEKNNVIKLQTKGKRKSIVLNPEALYQKKNDDERRFSISKATIKFKQQPDLYSSLMILRHPRNVHYVINDLFRLTLGNEGREGGQFGCLSCFFLL